MIQIKTVCVNITKCSRLQDTKREDSTIFQGLVDVKENAYVFHTFQQWNNYKIDISFHQPNKLNHKSIELHYSLYYGSENKTTLLCLQGK